MILAWAVLLSAVLADQIQYDRRERGQFGKLSEEEKKELSEQLGGIDIEKYRERLHAFGSRRHLKQLSSQRKAIIEEIQEKEKYVKHDLPNDGEPTDLVEINEKAGIAEYLFEGDILLSEEQLAELERIENSESMYRSKRQASTIYRKWTNNTLYYYFDGSLHENKRRLLAYAFEYISNRTCVNFVQDRSRRSRLKIQNGEGCLTTIGMFDSETTMTLSNGCVNLRSFVHETFHALGIFHMQSRRDRDNYVTLDMSDVEKNMTYNYDRETETTEYTPYEYGSTMHYPAYAFTKHSTIAMVPNDEKYLYTMGAPTVSMYDIMMINAHYNCDAQCRPETSAKCQNGGIPNPRDCSKCNCPDGYSGDLCDQRPITDGCGEHLNATEEWQTKSFEFGRDENKLPNLLSFCYHWISVPQGKRAELRLASMEGSQCVYGCPLTGIEFKVEEDKRKTNPRMCCRETISKVHQSVINPTPIIAYRSDNRNFKATFEYRYVDGTPEPVSPATTEESSSASTSGYKTSKPVVTTPREVVVSTTSLPVGQSSTKWPHRRTTLPAITPSTRATCVNVLQDSVCDRDGFCSSDYYPFQVKKYYCGKHCGLCGISADPCIDFNPNICRLGCRFTTPMEAEMNCARTCGFCEHPN